LKRHTLNVHQSGLAAIEAQESDNGSEQITCLSEMEEASYQVIESLNKLELRVKREIGN
jgi:hypothetical protein